MNNTPLSLASPKDHYLTQGKSFWNSFISPRKVDISSAFQSLEKSNDNIKTDFDFDNNIQLIQINKDNAGRESRIKPFAPFPLSQMSPRVPTTYFLNSSERRFMTNVMTSTRSTPFNSQLIRPATSQTYYNLQFNQGEKGSVRAMTSQPRPRTVIQSPRVQKVIVVSNTKFLKGLSPDKKEPRIIRVNLKSSGSNNQRKVRPVSQMEKTESYSSGNRGNKSPKINDRKVKTAMANYRKNIEASKLSNMLNFKKPENFQTRLRKILENLSTACS